MCRLTESRGLLRKRNLPLYCRCFGGAYLGTLFLRTGYWALREIEAEAPFAVAFVIIGISLCNPTLGLLLPGSGRGWGVSPGGTPPCCDAAGKRHYRGPPAGQGGGAPTLTPVRCDPCVGHAAGSGIFLKCPGKLPQRLRDRHHGCIFLHKTSGNKIIRR